MIQILDRKLKANYIIRIVDKKTGSSVIVSLFSEDTNLKSLKSKIIEALK